MADDAGVTVAICTHNRASLLPRCVPAAARECAQSNGRLLVVDNASTDQTSETLHRLARQDAFDVVREDRPGLSHARNRALAHAGEGWCLFLDDDAAVQPGWLAAMRAAMSQPEVAVLAGRVTPEFDDVRPPPWVLASERCRSLLSVLDLGSRPRLLAPAEFPVGANMGVDVAAALDVGGFHPRLGRSGRSLASMEEVDLVRRLRDRRFEAAWVPEAEVLHLIGGQRLSRGFLLRRAYWQGRSNEDALMLVAAATSPTSRGMRKLLAAGRNASRAALTRRRPDTTRFDLLLDAAHDLGRSRAAFGRAR